MTERIKALEALLYEFVKSEDRPCSFDHHGDCQEHGWFADDDTDPTLPVCAIRRGRDLLGLD